jgi:hypothetical protein
VSQNRLILGITISALLIILVISGSALLRNWNSSRAGTGKREPLAGLGYCSSTQVKPCILSFGLQPDGNMLVDILTDRSTPDFYLKIKSDRGETTYACQKARENSTLVSCTGQTAQLGEVLQFLLISTQEDTALAEGRFPVIGLALATPEIYQTPTPRYAPGKSPR